MLLANTGQYNFKKIMRCFALIRLISILLLISITFGCKHQHKKSVPREAVLRPATWSEISNWKQDDHLAAFRAFIRSCASIKKKKPGQNISNATSMGGKASDWQRICNHANTHRIHNSEQARAFFEKWFTPYKVFNNRNGDKGMITGYHEIQLNGSRKKTTRYKYPIYRVPKDIEKLNGKRHFTRAAIEKGSIAKQNLEMLWVDDAARLFFLHIQGCGTVKLEDGSIMKVRYANQNGWQYVCIMPYLKNSGAKRVHSVKDMICWLNGNGRVAEDVMNKNPSYVFFNELSGESPIGGQGVVLTPERSVAIDHKLYPYGAPIWIETKVGGNAYNRLFIAQDTGGVIKGAIRADVFFGGDQRAERLASGMNAQGKFYILLPKNVTPRSKYRAE